MDECLWRILVKNYNQIDKTKCGDDRGAAYFVLDRPAGSLELACRGVGIDPDDQPVDAAASLFKRVEMTTMQEIETAIGEPDG